MTIFKHTLLQKDHKKHVLYSNPVLKCHIYKILCTKYKSNVLNVECHFNNPQFGFLHYKNLYPLSKMHIYKTMTLKVIQHQRDHPQFKK